MWHRVANVRNSASTRLVFMLITSRLPICVSYNPEFARKNLEPSVKMPLSGSCRATRKIISAHGLPESVWNADKEICLWRCFQSTVDIKNYLKIIAVELNRVSVTLTDSSTIHFNYCTYCIEPFACPGASRNEYIDWYVDLDRLQLSLPDHFKKQEGIRSYSQCESQCHHRRACTEALFHNSTGTCFLAHFTRSAADRVCGRTANSILTQITCPTPGECLGMLKICENCGGASTADGLLHEAGCNAAIDLGHWCAMRNRYACQTNPLAKKCPVWVKEQYEQRATVVASTQNTAGLLRSFTSNNGAAADWTSIKNNADSNFSITLPIGPNKSFTFALPLKKLFGSFLGGKSPIQLIPSNPFASEHSRTTVSNSTEESTNSTLITDAQLTTTTINSISVADTNGTIVASNNTAS